MERRRIDIFCFISISASISIVYSYSYSYNDNLFPTMQPLYNAFNNGKLLVLTGSGIELNPSSSGGKG